VYQLKTSEERKEPYEEAKRERKDQDSSWRWNQ
jgi:hypothetical protein